jgi:thymidylate synthase
MNNIDKQYGDLVKDILENGVEKKDRTGTGTISVFGRQIRHKMSEGFPLLTTKKMAFKQIVTELQWFLSGSTNIKWLLKNENYIWVGDAYKNYIKKETERTEKSGDTWTLLDRKEFIEKIKSDEHFAFTFGELGPIYGSQWRKWKDADGNGIDQIENLMHELRNNPNSRRLMVSAWNVADLSKAVLPPCHYGFQCYTRELGMMERWGLKSGQVDIDDPDCIRKLDNLNTPNRAISLSWNQRSVDVGLGLPFNIASYALLLLMIADEVNMVPEEIIGNLGDTHIYKNHVEGLKEQIEREHHALPNVHVKDGIFSNMPDDVLLFNYESHPTIKLALSN